MPTTNPPIEATPAAPNEAERNGAAPLILTPDLLDWKWVDEERAKGAFVPYQGLHIAVLDKKVVGAAAPGPEVMTLSERVAERYGVDFRRVVVVYIDRPYEF